MRNTLLGADSTPIRPIRAHARLSLPSMSDLMASEIDLRMPREVFSVYIR